MTLAQLFQLKYSSGAYLIQLQEDFGLFGFQGEKRKVRRKEHTITVWNIISFKQKLLCSRWNMKLSNEVRQWKLEDR